MNMIQYFACGAALGILCSLGVACVTGKITVSDLLVLVVGGVNITVAYHVLQ